MGDTFTRDFSDLLSKSVRTRARAGGWQAGRM